MALLGKSNIRMYGHLGVSILDIGAGALTGHYQYKMY